jgi:hypothetical protein
MHGPPPIRFTGNPDVDWVLLVVVGVGVLYSLKAIRLSRDWVRSVLRLFVLGGLTGIAYYLWRGKASGYSVQAYILLFGFGALLFLPGKRSRYIPAAVKREVIARDFKGREHEYDPRKHHLDHKWAFSRRGGHTTDNLRVIDKQANLKKGKKRPGLWDMFFR